MAFNVFFFVMFMATEIQFFFSFEETLSNKFIALEFVYELTRITLEGMILYLAHLFGARVNVNANVNS